MITPTPAAARIVFWDVLRGVAVLGILLANMPYIALVGGITDPFGNHAGDGVLDHVSFYAVYVFADTKFITVFSILFGAGLAWMYQRIVDRGERFGRIYGRRLLVLAGELMSNERRAWRQVVTVRTRATVCGANRPGNRFGSRSPPSRALARSGVRDRTARTLLNGASAAARSHDGN